MKRKIFLSGVLSILIAFGFVSCLKEVDSLKSQTNESETNSRSKDKNSQEEVSNKNNSMRWVVKKDDLEDELKGIIELTNNSPELSEERLRIKQIGKSQDFEFVILKNNRETE